MSIFGKMKDAIFGQKDQPVAKPAAPTANTAPRPADPAVAKTPATAPAQPQVQKAISQDDVEQMLESKQGSDKLNWRTSIVDLMKLVGIDPSLENRKELAQELGYTGERNGSAEMNMWLHEKVMQELASHGGRVSSDLKD